MVGFERAFTTVPVGSNTKRPSMANITSGSKHRKRAMSMATGVIDKKIPSLSPRSKRRSLGPPKGILKSRMNLVDDANPPSITADYTIHNTQSLISLLPVDGDTTRRSLGSLSRRVSFAPHASVRTFDIPREANTNSTESPSSPPASDSDAISESHASKTVKEPSIKGVASFMSQSFDEEESMELDNTLDETDGDATMDATEMFGDGIVSRRRSSASGFRPAARSSLVPARTTQTRRSSVSESSMEDHPHPIGKPLKPPRPPSQAYLDLENIVNANFRPESDAGSDMDLDEAVRRLSAARESIVSATAEEESSNMSMNSSFQEDKTLDFRKVIQLQQSSRNTSDSSDVKVNDNLNPSMLDGRSYLHQRPASFTKNIFDNALLNVPLVDTTLTLPDDLSEVDMTIATTVQCDSFPPPSPDTIFKPLEDVLTSSSAFSAKPSESVTGNIFSPASSPILYSEQSPNIQEMEVVASTNSMSDSRSPLPSPGKKSVSSVLSEASAMPVKSMQSTNFRLHELPGGSNHPQITDDGKTGLHVSKGPLIRRPSGYSRIRRSTMLSRPPPISLSGSPQKATDSNEESFALESNNANIDTKEDELPLRSPRLAGRVRRSSQAATTSPNVLAEQHKLAREDKTSLFTSISIEQFFLMTGVKFMDEITCPRKSTIRPSSFGGHYDSRGSTIVYHDSDYFLANNVAIPQLHISSWVASELRKWIEDSKEIHRTAEEEVSKVPPAQFLAYAEADEDDRQQFTSHLKLVKACEQMRARATWYHWKYDWIAQSQDRADKVVEDLYHDQQVIQKRASQIQQPLHDLRSLHSSVIKELEGEEDIVREIELGDQQLLEELKVTIHEQTGFLEEYHTKVSEAQATLNSLDERLKELESQQAETNKDIENYRKKIILQTGSTKAGVFRLKDELDSIQELTMWQIKAVNSEMLQLQYGALFKVVIACQEYQPTPNIPEISVIPKKQRSYDCFADFPDLMIRMAHDATSDNLKTRANNRLIIHTLSSCWSSLMQIYSELSLLAAQCPVRLHLLPDDLLEVIVTLLFKKVSGKAILTFRMNKHVMLSWPMALHELQIETHVIYGPLDCDVLTGAVKSRLVESSSGDSHACLQDACCAALAQYQ